MTNAKEQLIGLINEVPTPINLSEKEVVVAKAFALNKVTDRISIADFCKEHQISTKTFIKYKSEVRGFENYITNMVAHTSAGDVDEIFQNVDKAMLRLSRKDNLTLQDVKVINDWYAGHREVVKRKIVQAGGIGEEETTQQSVEEKKKRLVERLRGGNQ